MCLRIFNVFNCSAYFYGLNRSTFIKQQITRLIMSQNHNLEDNLRDIRGGSDHYRNLNFPDVVPGRNHFVLYDPRTLGQKPPRPANDFVDDVRDWNNTQDFVRMPYSENSVLNGKPRWAEIIKELAHPGYNSRELVQTILSYNPGYSNKWKFTSLYALLDDEISPHEQSLFFRQTLPKIAELAIRLPELVTQPIPLLRQGTNDCLSLSQQQIGSLLANAFFCTFPFRNSDDGPYKTYPGINFSKLYAATGHDVLEKLKCIIHYFRTITKNEHAMPTGVLTFCRRSVDVMPRWEASQAYIGDIPFHANADALIERCHGLIQLDFANKYLGGGVLGHGSVQEEIRFVICPELIITKLFTEVLRDDEALLMIGPQRYSLHEGYSRTFEWVSGYADETPRDRNARRRVAVLAIDALPFHRKWQEAKKENIDRELNKAWVGFSFFTPRGGGGVNYPGVATGNWGCGAFGGTPQLKSLLQICAAAHARRPVLYVTFDDEQFRDDLDDMYKFLKNNNVSVPQLYRHILDFARRDKVDFNQLFDYLKSVIPGRSSGGHDRTPTREARTKNTRQLTLDWKPTTRKSHYSTRSQPNSQHTQQELNAQDLIEAELNSEDFKLLELNTEDLKEIDSLAAQRANSPDLFTSEEMIIDDSHLQNCNQMETSELKTPEEMTIDQSQLQNCNKTETAELKTPQEMNIDQSQLQNCNKTETAELKTPQEMNIDQSQLQNCNKTTTPELKTSQDMTIDQSQPQNCNKTETSEFKSPEEMIIDQSKAQNCNRTETPEFKIEKMHQPFQRKRMRHVSDSDDEIAGKVNKMAATEDKTASHTSRLFDQLEKFDETNGNLNLSFSNRKHFDGEVKKTVLNSYQEMAPEVKKKIVRKITDFYSKTDKKS